MSTAGIFSDATDSLFNGDKNFELAFSENVGTLVFSGWGHDGSTQVYIITQNSNWNKIEDSDKYLDSFHNPDPSSDYDSYGVIAHEDKIYLIGGYSNFQGSVTYHNTIQVINFSNLQFPCHFLPPGTRGAKWLFG